METIAWICQYLLFPIIIFIVSFYLGIWKERTSSKKNHDRKIFSEIKKILNDEEFMDIALNPGYLPSDTFSKCDALSAFIVNPGNEFIDEKTNKAFYDFQISFFHLNDLYSRSPYGDRVGDNKFKLIANKSGDPKEDKLLDEAKVLGTKTEKNYRNFRRLIKKKLHV